MKRDRAAKARRSHFRRRMMQRYGFDVDRRDVVEITRMISDGLYVDSLPLTSTRKACLVEWKGRRIWVVYSRTREEVVTALTPEMIDEHRRTSRKPDPVPRDLSEELRRRWNVRLTPEALDDVVDDIRNGRSLDAVRLERKKVAHLVKIDGTPVWWVYEKGGISRTMSRRWVAGLESGETRMEADTLAKRLVDGPEKNMARLVGRNEAVTILRSYLSSRCERKHLEKAVGGMRMEQDVKSAVGAARAKIGRMTGVDMRKKEGLLVRILRIFVPRSRTRA